MFVCEHLHSAFCIDLLLVLKDRSVALVTYAMCGFSSISTLAIAVGVWYSICPQRVKLMVSMMFRVFVEANFSCYMTACVAGKKPDRV